MKRCSKCILPETYAGINFDENGVCNYCNDWQAPQYEDESKLVDLIKSHKGNSKYDCAIGFSGGRDSTYLMYYASKILKLKVIGFAIDNGYMSPESVQNIKTLADKLQVDVVFRKHDYLKRAFPYNLKTWLAKPDPAMILALCNGCRYGYSKLIYELMHEYGCRVYMDGSVNLEKGHYKTQLLSLKPTSKSKMVLYLGGILHLIKNPQWILKPFNTYIFYNDFASFMGKKYKKMLEKKGILYISPFNQYIKWNEKTINDVLENELDWIKNKRSTSTWRTDCVLAPLKLHFSLNTMDYTDKTVMLSALIRDGQITREEALERLEKENKSSVELVNEALKTADISYEEMEKAIEMVEKSNLPEKVNTKFWDEFILSKYI